MEARQIGDLQRPHRALVLALLAGDEAGRGVADREEGIRRDVLDPDDHILRNVQVGDRRLEIDGYAAQLAVASFTLSFRLQLMLCEGLGLGHDSEWRRSWLEARLIGPLRLTKVSKAEV